MIDCDDDLYNDLWRLELERKLLKIDAKESFPRFLDYMDARYSRQWFHTVIAQH